MRDHMEQSSLSSTMPSTLKAITATNHIPFGNRLADGVRSNFAQARYKECAALSSDAMYYIYSLIGVRKKKCGRRREIFRGKHYQWESMRMPTAIST
jgi:hypothetical protein